MRYLRQGEPFVWLTAAGLAACLLLIIGLVVLIAEKGFGYFWPRDLVEFTLEDGSRCLGELSDREVIPAVDLPPEERSQARYRVQLKVGNRDIYGSDFRWIPESEIASRGRPEDAVQLERVEWGNFYGYVDEVREGEKVLGRGDEAWKALLLTLDKVDEAKSKIREVQKRIDKINHTIRQLELTEKRALYYEQNDEAASLHEERGGHESKYEIVRAELDAAVRASMVWQVKLRTTDGRTEETEAAAILRALRPNSMSTAEKVSLYLGRLWEFVSGEPREANTEGGVFPAIFGTVMMVILMSLAVVPFGVVAAIYLREYAKEGFVVRSVRIAVNNLAGIPSIVYGVFGLGFFIYFLGGSIDQLFYPERLPTPTWGTGGIFWASLTLALLTVPVVIVSTEEALAAVPRELREGSLALGGTKIQTVLRVVLPCATPGVLTGAILAMARGAGEVAPLMITGVVKLAPSMPVDGHFPYVHLERKFMHLGFHIFDVGFQPPNVEAAKPILFATTLLLLLIVVALNLAAILIRNRLRRRYAVGH